MSVRPAVDVVLRSSPVPATSPTDTGQAFFVGLTDTGPANSPQVVQNIADFERIFGLRQTYSVLYDAVDIFFREGGGASYVSRVVGPGATTGSHNLLDGAAAVSLVASALGPGAGSGTISVGVRAGVGGGTFVVYVVVGGVEVETSPDLADTNSAVLWAANSSYIRLALGASANNPAVAAAVALSAGNDDRANITDAQWQSALDSFTNSLGTGQVLAPGRTSDVGHTQLLDHAYNHRRLALLDAPDTSTVATLQSSATNSRAGNQRFGGMFWPQAVCTGVVNGTTRKVPWSAVQAGIIARNDSDGLGPSDPAAGDNGVSLTAIDLSQPAVIDSVRNTLNSSGVNVVRMMFGSARTYGWRSLADPVADSDWVDLGHARLWSIIATRGALIGQNYLFDKLDGQGRKIAEFNKDLKGMLSEYWVSGDLYGTTADEAYKVDTDSVNTPQTLQADELHAVMQVRMSPFAEYVRIEIVKRPITEVL